VVRFLKATGIAASLAMFVFFEDAEAACELGKLYVSATALNVRTAPINGDTVGKAHRGQRVTVYHCQDVWAKISNEGSPSRWVHSGYLSINKPTIAKDNNWLLGEWRGLKGSCPPRKGMRYSPNEVIQFTRYIFGYNIKASVKYEIAGDEIKTKEILSDGSGGFYVYKKKSDKEIEVIDEYDIDGSKSYSNIGYRYIRCKK